MRFHSWATTRVPQSGGFNQPLPIKWITNCCQRQWESKVPWRHWPAKIEVWCWGHCYSLAFKRKCNTYRSKVCIHPSKVCINPWAPLLCIIYNCAVVISLTCATGTVLDPGGHRQTAIVTVLLRYGQCSSVHVTGTIRYGYSRERDQIDINSRPQHHCCKNTGIMRLSSILTRANVSDMCTPYWQGRHFSTKFDRLNFYAAAVGYHRSGCAMIAARVRRASHMITSPSHSFSRECPLQTSTAMLPMY